MGHDASHHASHENGGADEIDVTGLTGAGGGGGAPTTVDYLVGTADAGLSAEIVVGTSPGGELGGTWAAPTVDATHSGSTHAATQAAAEATASGALTTHAAAADPHTGYVQESLIDAAGDLIVGTADNTVGRLAKGTALQVLRTNAGATALEWATPAGGSVATDAIWDAAGDLAIGTGADTAAKLGITVPAANILEVLGVVNGETTATWKAVHDGTAPVTQALADAAAAGTALTAAHRDHKHGMFTAADVITALSGAVGGLPKIVRRTSDSSAKTNNTIASDDTLLWAVGASEVWFFEAYLYLNSANVTMDAKIGFSVPSGTTMMWGYNADTASGSGNYSRIGVATSQIAISTEASTPASGSAANATYGLALAGHVIVSSTPGNVNLQWAQNTTDAGNLVMKTQSMIRAWRVA